MRTNCTRALQLIECVPAPQSTACKYIKNKLADSQSISHSTGISELYSRLGAASLTGDEGGEDAAWVSRLMLGEAAHKNTASHTEGVYPAYA